MHSARVPGGAGFASLCLGGVVQALSTAQLEEIGLWGPGRQFPVSTCSLVTHMTECSRHSLLSTHILRRLGGLQGWGDLHGLVWGSRTGEKFSKVLPFWVLNLIPYSLPGVSIL